MFSSHFKHNLLFLRVKLPGETLCFINGAVIQVRQAAKCYSSVY